MKLDIPENLRRSFDATDTCSHLPNQVRFVDKKRGNKRRAKQGTFSRAPSLTERVVCCLLEPRSHAT